MSGGFTALGPSKQLQSWGDRVTDPRSRIATGYPSLDSLLYRGGFAPGELVILGGRTGTRKTTFMANLIANMLQNGTFVGMVGLDEPPPSYVAKLASVLLGIEHGYLEDPDVWRSKQAHELRKKYEALTENLVVSKGYRPFMRQLTAFKEQAEAGRKDPMRVLFIDYVSLLGRDKYAGGDVQRIPRLIEELQVWTNEQEMVTIALHQVGRTDEGAGVRYHGDTPMSLEGLKYGGEEIADVVLSTYRPAKSRLGNMSWDNAQAFLPQSWDYEKKCETWEEAHERVRKYQNNTFVQFLKNRPGADPPDWALENGICLSSEPGNLRMVEGGPSSELGADLKYTGAVA